VRDERSTQREIPRLAENRSLRDDTHEKKLAAKIFGIAFVKAKDFEALP
jgi:hypothetical protein